MKHEELIKAGFKPVDDPQFKYELKIDLSDNQEHEEMEIDPILLWDNENGRFCLKAIEWVNAISHFETK